MVLVYYSIKLSVGRFRFIVVTVLQQGGNWIANFLSRQPSPVCVKLAVLQVDEILCSHDVFDHAVGSLQVSHRRTLESVCLCFCTVNVGQALNMTAVKRL